MSAAEVTSSETGAPPKPQLLAPSQLRVLWDRVREYGATTATELSIMAAQVLVYRLAATYLGQQGFSEYAVARRVLSVLQPVVLFGFAVGLPRYIAFADGRGEQARSGRYFAATLHCVGALALAFALLLVASRSFWSFLLFGSKAYVYLVGPLALMIVSVTLHAVIYAYLRGKLAISRANLLAFLNLGVAPLVAFWFFGRTALAVLWAIAAFWMLISLAVLSWVPIRGIFRGCASECKQLLSYGWQRVPGDFALMALFALPAVLLAHVRGIAEAGLVAFGVSLVNMIASVFAPVGIIVLPKVSNHLASGSCAELRGEIVMIGKLSVAVPLVLILVLEFTAAPLIHLYFGPGFEGAIPIVRVLMPAALPLSVYYGLRSVVDAFYEQAINTLNLLISLVVFLLGTAASVFAYHDPSGCLWSFLIATVVLALLTVLWVKKIFRNLATENATVALS